MHSEDAHTCAVCALKGKIPVTCIMGIQVVAAILDKVNCQKVPKMVVKSNGKHPKLIWKVFAGSPDMGCLNLHHVLILMGMQLKENHYALSVSITYTCSATGHVGIVYKGSCRVLSECTPCSGCDEKEVEGKQLCTDCLHK
ncbi:Hypothetical predicted protein, partial [Pelobates cultripes]